ncbi:Na+/H+ antiporter NhaC family protein [Guggenheimella bovis]
MDFDVLSVLPPVIAIVLALITKEVISSLFIGILVGVLIFSQWQIIPAYENLFNLMSTKLGENSGMILFLGLLGVIVVLVTKAGGSQAYGKWATKKIRNRAGAQVATGILGILIFIDDYFNCLTIGTVMRPVTDAQKVSRAKLAYLIDSTAAPVCILMPISSWGASVVATIGDTGVAEPMNTFVSSIPYNFYAIFAIIVVFFFALTDRDFGPMRKFEENDTSRIDDADDSINVEISPKGTVWDLVIPVLVLVFCTVIFMLYTGGFFAGEGKSLYAAFGDSGVSISLVFGAIVALIVCMVMYLPRKLMTFTSFMDSFNSGVKSMVPAMIILTLAWTIGGVCSSDYLNTGAYVGKILKNSVVPVQILPALVFIVGAVLSFSTGTAWGTFGILVPIMIPIIQHLGAMDMLPLFLGAIFSGSVFGDHCSPISDTTILSSAGAQCRHIDHVASQIPYASATAVSALVGFILTGLTGIYWLGLIGTIVVLFGFLMIVTKKDVIQY